MSTDNNLKLVVLASGGGSNFQAIAESIKLGQLDASVSAVVSDVPQAGVLQRAAALGISSAVVDFDAYEQRPDFDQAMRQQVAALDPDLVVLAGYMRILDTEFVDHYAGRLINIHPSLLPRYRGLHTHRRVLADGARKHGATVHFVVPKLDAGPIIVQAELTVDPEDDENGLAARVLRLEHVIYPLAIQWLSEQRLTISGDTVLLDGYRSAQQYLSEGDINA